MNNEERAKRGLKAILSADVKGYSRLMGEDELGTINRLKEYQQVMADHIQYCGGRVVDSPGDNMLAEFGSVVDAVECSVEIQKELKKRNAPLPNENKMEFRLGVNLGDVVEDGDKIFGDGVNVAARIEGLAEAGGICISRSAFDQVKNKLSIGYEYLGEHSVKNIKDPVGVYRVLLDAKTKGSVVYKNRRDDPRHRRRATIIAATALVIVIAIFSLWKFYLRTPSFEPASMENMAYPLPDKPSIAVLPFNNLSGDPDQEYISDGLTEEIITGLSKIPDLFVIARNSSFTYKDKPVKVQQVSEELGVRYVLEGSFRMQDDRIRVTAQLIDAIKGYHIWSENYDRKLTDLITLQEDIMIKIMKEIEVQLTEGEQARYWTEAKNKPFDLAYWQKWKLMIWHNNRASPEDHEIARRLANELIEMDPTRAEGYAALGWLHFSGTIHGRSKNPKKSMELAEQYAHKASQFDETAARTRELRGWLYNFKGRPDLAIAEMKKWVAAEPNGAQAHFNLGSMFLFSGRREDAIREMEIAIRLDPFPFNWSYSFLAQAYAGFFLADGPKDIDKAEALSKKAIKMNPFDHMAQETLILIYAYQNRLKEARAHATELLKFIPNYSILGVQHKYKDKEARDRNVDLLRKAGIPEG
jgi:adenylate cyclase